jgi:hypothetical protein
MENFNDPIRNPTRDRPAQSAVTQPRTFYNKNIQGKFGLAQYNLPYLCHMQLLAKAQLSHPPSKAILILSCST